MCIRDRLYPRFEAAGGTPPYRKVRTDAPGIFKRSPPSQIEHIDTDRGVMDISCRPERTLSLIHICIWCKLGNKRYYEEAVSGGFLFRRYYETGFLAQDLTCLLYTSNPDAATPREGRRSSDCKLLSSGKIMTVPEEEAPANYVPAAAVIRREQALSGFTGCKGCVGGSASQ